MLEKNDEVKIEKIVTKVVIKVVGNALEEIVLPRLQNIEDKLEVIFRWPRISNSK